ncbi:MAG: endolytic transglycosylase MltG, partial [bacterium]
MKPRYFVPLCWAWILCVWLKMAFYTDFQKEALKEISVPQGTPVSKVAQILDEEGVVSRYLFRLFVFLSQKERIIAGRYRLAPGTSMSKIVQQLENGPPRERITFPEGFTAAQMAEFLEEKGICKGEEYLALTAHPELFQREWLQGVSHLEGFLFPDTYYFPLPSSPQEVIETQLKRFEE